MAADLREFGGEEEFRAAFAKAYPDYTPQKASEKARELWTLRELESGGIVIANKGASEVLAIGEVTEAGYEWRPSRDTYKHTVNVKWDASRAARLDPHPVRPHPRLRRAQLRVHDMIDGLPVRRPVPALPVARARSRTSRCARSRARGRLGLDSADRQRGSST